MDKSGLWIGKPKPDSNALKAFKPQLDRFVEQSSGYVKADKVGQAQKIADETKVIANKNIKMLAQNNYEI